MSIFKKSKKSEKKQGPLDFQIKTTPAKVKKNNGRVEVYQDRRKQFRWRLIARNGKIVATSHESFTRKRTAKDSAERFVEIATTAKIIEEEK